MISQCYIKRGKFSTFIANFIKQIVPLVFISPINPIQKGLLDLAEFINEIIEITGLSDAVLLSSWIYLNRFQEAVMNIGLKGLQCTGHRLFLTSINLACKFLDDIPLGNSAWAEISVYFTVTDVNLMEIQFLTYIEYDLIVFEPEILQARYEIFKSQSNFTTQIPSFCNSESQDDQFDHLIIVS
jgi:hypothetical protein